MKADSQLPRPQEIELKLALPTSDPASLAKRLARLPVLARRKATQLHLHNIYVDSPEQLLRQQRIALRLRRVGSEATPSWLQTLKTGGRNDSALSLRGEWEVPVSDAVLSRKALKGTPWSGIDPDGTLFATLAPVFVTTFERKIWLVRRRDASVIEVALDIGQIVAGTSSCPICELELELKVGRPAALFELAQEIAQTIAVLPVNVSKAERGYTLAQGIQDAPLHAMPVPLGSDLSLTLTAQRVLSEMFGQFTTNLNALRNSDDPEVVHQARVGWRRFKSARRLFRPILAIDTMPQWQALQPLLSCLGKLRDLDVARLVTLPPVADAYTAGNPRRLQAWHAMLLSLTQAAELQRKTVRYALQEPAVGAGLLATSQWLEGLAESSVAGSAKPDSKMSIRRWVGHRIERLHQKLESASAQDCSVDQQHRIRILAKRMRYGIEALHSQLPKKRAQRWQRQASSLQASIGLTRDLMQAAMLVAELEIDRGLAEFLRGLAAGQKS
ncbi:MAG: CHAD domain-containing protein [Comamonadaceae bacterium]